MRATQDFFAVTAPGLEAQTAAELAGLGLEVGDSVWGGVSFRGTLQQAFRVHLHARTPVKILWRLGEFRARSFPELYNHCQRLDWGRTLKAGVSLSVRASAKSSRLHHTRRIAEVVLDAVGSQVAVVPVSEAEAGEDAQRLQVRFEDDRATMSMDMSGALLHRRGYRQASGRAPLRETMAAALLSWAGWTGEVPLLDPMCGSGTFLIEGAWIAQGRAPGLDRGFAFEGWARYDQHGWRRMVTEARQLPERQLPALWGWDRAEAALEAARGNAARAGVDGALRLSLGDFAQAAAPEGATAGLIICNPPYGERIGRRDALRPLYEGLGRRYAGLPGWRGVVLGTDEALLATFERAVGRPRADEVSFQHGGLKVAARRYDL